MVCLHIYMTKLKPILKSLKSQFPVRQVLKQVVNLSLYNLGLFRFKAITSLLLILFQIKINFKENKFVMLTKNPSANDIICVTKNGAG